MTSKGIFLDDLLIDSASECDSAQLEGPSVDGAISEEDDAFSTISVRSGDVYDAYGRANARPLGQNDPNGIGTPTNTTIDDNITGFGETDDGDDVADVSASNFRGGDDKDVANNDVAVPKLPVNARQEMTAKPQTYI